MPEDDAGQRGDESKVEAALQEADVARREGRFEAGVSVLLDAIGYGVRTDQVYYRLGNIYLDAGDLERAEYGYHRALQVNPQHINAHYNMAVVYRQTGRLSHSVKLRKRAVRLQAMGGSEKKWMGGERPRLARLRAGPDGSMDATGAVRVSSGEEREYLKNGVFPGTSAESGLPDEERDAADLAPRNELKDDAAIRQWGRRLIIVSMAFVGAVAVLFLLVLYFLGRYIF